SRRFPEIGPRRLHHCLRRVRMGKVDTRQCRPGIGKPDSRVGRFRDHDVTRESFVKRSSLVKTAAVFQRPTALPQMTVSQNLHLALSLAGVPRKDRDERIKEALAFFGLDKIERSYPDGLSAGQRRRIDLARALAVKPELLVIDEPTGD